MNLQPQPSRTWSSLDKCSRTCLRWKIIRFRHDGYVCVYAIAAPCSRPVCMCMFVPCTRCSVPELLHCAGSACSIPVAGSVIGGSSQLIDKGRRRPAEIWQLSDGHNQQVLGCCSACDLTRAWAELFPQLHNSYLPNYPDISSSGTPRLLFSHPVTLVLLHFSLAPR